jgi:D-lactate dehydrogenase (cytochrome)
MVVENTLNDLVQQLQALLGPAAVSTSIEVLNNFSHDESSLPPVMPQVVCWPETAEQVAGVLRLANERRIPVTARGGGSSLEGNALPTPGGIVLALERMNRVLEILPQDFQVRVQPGVVYEELNRQLARYGLFFAPGPSSANVATIGGMIGNNAGGLNALRYGATRDHVLRIQVAFADGSLYWFGTRAMRTSSGYDLVRLIVGSEGTLGIVTEVVLRLHGIPEKRTALARFSALETAAQVVFEVMQSGILPGALELMDATSIHYLNVYKGWTWPEQPTLLFEFHGTPKGIEEEVEIARRICAEHGASLFCAASPDQRDQLWAGRKEITRAEQALYPGYDFIKGDIAVPLSQYVPTILEAKRLAQQRGLNISLFGHAGDGSLHSTIPVPPDDAPARINAERVMDDLIRFALSVGGTASGEHGIGLAKRKYLIAEHGAAVEVMKSLKQALDPNGILNPDKMFSEA